MALLQIKGGLTAIVDEDDLPALNTMRWRPFVVAKHYRYIATVGRSQLLLHRYITSAPKGMVVDHINGNPLDNRKENLRVCTQGQNMANRKRQKNSTCRFKGVGRSYRGHSWSAAIGSSSQKSRKYLGSFPTEEEAAAMYDIAAVLTFGEFACLNFPHVFPELSQRKA